MSIKEELLNVWSKQHIVGQLWRGSDGRTMGFEYSPTWRDNGYAISNSLPLSKGRWMPEEETAHLWFANLLPEEQSRAALVKRLSVADDDFSLLKALGGDCAGALVILPQGESPVDNGGHQALSIPALEEWAAGKTGRYSVMTSQYGYERPRLSLAGAQDKIPVLMHQGKLALPVGATPSSHILKFALGGRRPIVLSELFLNTLARLVGLECPTTRIVRFGSHPCLLVERYDRRVNAAGVLERLHQEDMCQAMGLGRYRKYQDPDGPGFGDCIAMIRSACRPSAMAILQLIRWQIFNTLTGNTDGHAKNISLLQDGHGRWHLAPAYDLLSTIVLGYNTSLAMSVGQQFNSQQLLKRDWEQLAHDAGISFGLLRREVPAMIQKLQSAIESQELKNRLLEVGMDERDLRSLQQHQMHISRQCKKAQKWI